MGGSDPTPPVPAAHFVYARVPRDRLWAVLFALAWLAALAAGGYGVTHRNPAILHLDDPAVCPYQKGSNRALLEALQVRACRGGGVRSPAGGGALGWVLEIVCVEMVGCQTPFFAPSDSSVRTQLITHTHRNCNCRSSTRATSLRPSLCG